jgi:hypothetical protein
MPSQLHEALLLLFRNRPALAPELVENALHIDLPAYSEVRVESAELTHLQPPEYRADLVVLLYEGRPVYGIVVEAQLQPDDDKLFSWPSYATLLRARIRCESCVLVITVDNAVARWAAQPIRLGGGNLYAPLVLGPSGVPEVTEEQQARAEPELAVLSAMAHGKGADTEKALRIAVAAMTASVGLDEERSKLYFDLVAASLGEAARRALQSMDPAQYEYQSEFALRYLNQGRAEGRTEGEARGRAEVVLKLLALRFGPLAEPVRESIRAASIEQLDTFAERLLTASSLEEVLSAK